MMNNIFEKLKKMFKTKQKELDYPQEFLMVTYTKYALEDGTTEDSNKVIIHYWHDDYGNQKETRYRYSPERLETLRKNHMIPVYDKTEINPILPIFKKLLPQELKWLENV